MISKFLLCALTMSCLFHGGFAHKDQAELSHRVPPKAAPVDPTSFLEELQSHLRVRHLQVDGTQDIGETCVGSCSGLKCKAGLECKRASQGICICGLTCNPGTCQLAPTPAPTPAPAPGIACFSASATVQTADRGMIKMKDVVIGEKVLTNAKTNQYEDVYAFGHWHPTVKATFLQIHTQNQITPLEITEDHMLQVNGGFVKASSVQAGDALVDGQGIPTKVTKIRSVTRNDGVYAPLTPSGTLLVDNVVVSAYVSLQEKGNEYPVFANGLLVPISQQVGIHMGLSPYRVLCVGLNMDGLCHHMTAEGISSYVSVGIELAKYADNLSQGTQLVLFVLAVALVVPLFVLEILFGARYAPLVAFVLFVAMMRVKKRGLGASKRKSL